ncbi:transposase [Candidatus Symbiothrix dinenymphae]|nr:transposase [Candidatus Symbiothrix dinenymphae]
MKRLSIGGADAVITSIQAYFEKNEEAKFIHRLHGILLFASKETESCDSIGALFGNSPRTISNWIKKVIATGDINSLREHHRPGRPPRLSLSQQEDLKKVLQDSPEKHGMPCNIWDGKSLSAYIKEHYDIELKVRACQNLFHTLGFSLKRARPVVCRTDEEKKALSKKNFKRK